MHPSQISAVKQRVLRADTQRLARASVAALSSDDPAKHWASMRDKPGQQALDA
jgi:cbb3-type cytochrome oxidase cytochrome c subunit